MPTQKKIELVEVITDKLSRSQIVVLTDYRGLTVPQISDLRRRLRRAGTEYRVMKNRLVERAAHQTGKEPLVAFLTGPTAVAFGYGDIVETAKVLVEYAKGTTTFSIKGGILDGRLLQPADIETLAYLPPRQELIAKALAGMQAPLYQLVSVLSAPLRGLAYVLQARSQQLAEG